MASSTIANLTAVSSVAGADEFPVQKSGESTAKKATLTQILSGMNLGALYQPLDSDLTTWAGLTPSANAQSLVTAANYAAMRALLDLEAGTDFLSPAAIAAAYQPLDADLTTWAGLAPSANAQSLVTAADYAAMRTLLGLGTAALAATGDFAAASHSHAASDITSGQLAIARGGLGVDLSSAPGADRLLFWDHSALAFAYLTVGTGLSITTTTISATGTGDVVGPASATDNAIARFDLTTGKLIQNSAATVADTTGTIDNSAGGGKFLSGSATGTTHFVMGAADSSHYGLGLDGNGTPSIQRGDGGAIHLLRVSKVLLGATYPEIAPNGSGGILLSSASGIPGHIGFSVNVETNTAVAAAPNVLAANESGKSFNNTGATALNVHNLPACVAGYQYSFRVTDADGIKVNAVGDDTIRFAATVSGAAGYIQSTTIGDCWTLEGQDATQWLVVASVGAGIAVT